MIRRDRFRTPALFSILVFGGLLAGCGGTTEPWSDPEGGLILTYRLADGESLQYRAVVGFEESMRIQGRTVGMRSLNTTDLTVIGGYQEPEPKTPGPEATIGIVPAEQIDAARQAAAGVENGLLLTLHVDGFSSTVNAMGRELTRDVGEVIDKSIYMALSPRGEPLAIAVGDLQYRVGPFGFRTLDTDFADFFPVMAEAPVKVGETWVSTADVVDTRDAEMTMALTFENTLEGVEVVEGLDCARVVSKVLGRLSGETRAPGQDITFRGDITGEDRWLFAYKEGRLVSRQTEINIAGDATDLRGNQGQGMNVPMTRKITYDIQLAR
jgi:hypothetical protein